MVVATFVSSYLTMVKKFGLSYSDYHNSYKNDLENLDAHYIADLASMILKSSQMVIEIVSDK